MNHTTTAQRPPTPVVEVYDAHLPSLRSVATLSERVCRRLPAYDAAMPVEKLLAQRNGPQSVQERPEIREPQD